jgi:hypothetical protein
MNANLMPKKKGPDDLFYDIRVEVVKLSSR